MLVQQGLGRTHGARRRPASRRQLHRARDKPVDWTPQQGRAFPLNGDRRVTWADWDEDLLSLELEELNAVDFALSLTGFDAGELDGLLAIPDEERANAATPIPKNPRPGVSELRLRKTSGAVRKMQSGRKMSRGSLPSASRSGWYRIPRPPSDSIASGATAPD